MENLIGNVYGKWVVIDYGNRTNYSLCKCDCGTIKNVRNDHLKDGRSKSCGCLKKEQHPWIYKGNPDRAILNKIYGNMKNRCNNPSSDSYARYGGAGITVCDEWNNSFEVFADWAYESGYKKGLSIDRIDNNLGYSPGNCRWVTKKEQNYNKKTNVVLIIDGVRYIASQAAKKAGIKPSKIYYWLDRGVPMHEVISRLKAVKWDVETST